MNFGEIKSFLKGSSLFDAPPAQGGKPQGVANGHPQLGKLSGSAAVFMRSQTSLSFSVLNTSLSEKLQGAGFDMSPDAIAAKAKENASMFDFEAVAENVLKFVETAVMKAKGEGADDEALKEMMSKARQGVDEGFAMAREELEGMGEMNDELSDGIDKSYDLIQNGLDRFQQRLFGEGPGQVGAPGQVQGQAFVGAASEINYSLNKSSSISIQTQDGDTVTIDFAEALRYQRSEAYAAYQGQNEDGSVTSAEAYSLSESRYHAVGFSFSVEGELDEGEKEAIAELVQDVSKLADEFFNGDLDKAFEQATQLGFDESELSGFSLQMTRQESFSVAQAYQQVADMQPRPRPDNAQGRGPDAPPPRNPEADQMMRPVANYFKDLMDFLEKARERLDGGNDLQQLVSESVNKYLEFRGETEVTLSIERFAQFNQQLLNTLDTPADGAQTGSEGQGEQQQPDAS